MMNLTRDDITSIHSILIFDEPEAIHELDFRDLSGTMGVEVRLHISLGSYAIKLAVAAFGDSGS
jgi:hypothetical protein